MKSLVIYDSRFGNTKEIAEIVAEVTGGETLCVTDFTPSMLAEVDLVIIGSPIHGWHPSEATSNFLAHLEASELKGKYVAAFDTGYASRLSGSAADRIMKALKKAGGIPLIPTHKFIVEGAEGPLGPDETTRANVWGHELKTEYERLSQHAGPVV